MTRLTIADGTALSSSVERAFSGPAHIIDRCTRNGVTSWQNVANQLGRSVDSVRCQFDPGYRTATALHVVPDPPEEPLEPTDLSSPYNKGPGLHAEILALLEHSAQSVEAIAGRLAKTPLSIRKRLNEMLARGRVFHDGAIPRTWGLIEADGKRRVYAAVAVATHAKGFNEAVDRATSLKFAMNTFNGGRYKARMQR